jgi:hypothetical protein
VEDSTGVCTSGLGIGATPPVFFALLVFQVGSQSMTLLLTPAQLGSQAQATTSGLWTEVGSC